MAGTVVERLMYLSAFAASRHCCDIRVGGGASVAEVLPTIGVGGGNKRSAVPRLLIEHALITFVSRLFGTVDVVLTITFIRIRTGST